MSALIHPAAPHHLPAFISAPGEADALMVVMAIFLIGAVLALGLLFLRLHTLPERMAHKSQKLQFEIVAVLGLLSLFTHQHIFWVAGLLLALIDLPDFGTPLRRMVAAMESLVIVARGGNEKLIGNSDAEGATPAPQHSAPPQAGSPPSDVLQPAASPIFVATPDLPPHPQNPSTEQQVR